MAAVVEEEGLGASLTLVVSGARPNWIDDSPIGLWLGVNRWVTVDFACRRLQDFDLQSLRQPEHVDGAEDACLGGLDRILLVVDGGSRASEIEDLVDLDKKRVGDVVAQKLKLLVG